jgi:glycosyltransferase involved in cell wall biosynthesis
MRVLHIIPSVEAEAAQLMLSRLLEDAAQRRQETAVLSLQPPGEMGEYMRARGIRLFSLRLEQPWQLPLAMLRLARIANAFAPDILHGWMHEGSVAASLARAITARPVSVVWNLRDPLGSESLPMARGWRQARLGAWMSARADAIVYNSRMQARQHTAAGYHIEHSLLIPDGFDTGLHRPSEGARDRLCANFGIDPKAVVIGHMAARHPKNDQTMLVEAVARARAIGQDLHLLMVGSGLDAPGHDLHDLASRLLPAGRVTFSGARADLAEWLPGLDMLAASTAWGDDVPQAIGQALASGVPVVATELGDSVELVGPCGRIVPPQDPVGFGEAVLALAAMGPDQRRQLGEAGRQRVIERFSLETALDRYRELHQRLHGDPRFLGRPAGRHEALAGGPQQ